MSHPISSSPRGSRLALIDSFRSRKQFYFATLAVIGPLLTLLLAIWLATIADVWLGLHATSRWITLLSAISLAIAVGVHFGFAPAVRWSRKHTIREIERRCTHVGQIVRTADQLVHDQTNHGATSAELSECVKGMAEQQLASLDLERLICWRPVRLALAGLVCCTLLLLCSTIWHDFRVGLRRVFWPPSHLTYTTVELQSTEEFGLDEPIEIHARIIGRGVDDAVLHFRSDNQDWSTARMKQIGTGHWQAVLEGNQENVDLYVSAGDGRSRMNRARFVFKPKIETIAVRLVYPEYTALAPARLSEGSFRAVEGTRAAVDFTLNQAVSQAHFVVNGKPVRTIADGPTVSFEHRVTRGTTEYTLKAANNQQLELAATTFTVIGDEDQLPEVEIIQPQGDMQVTSVTELPVRVRVRDDYGVQKLVLVVEKDQQRQEHLLRQVNDDEYLLADEQQTKLMLERLNLAVNENLRIYAYARDRNPLHDKLGVSELTAVDIQPFQRPFIKSGGS